MIFKTDEQYPANAINLRTIKTDEPVQAAILKALISTAHTDYSRGRYGSYTPVEGVYRLDILTYLEDSDKYQKSHRGWFCQVCEIRTDLNGFNVQLNPEINIVI